MLAIVIFFPGGVIGTFETWTERLRGVRKERNEPAHS